MHQALAPAKPRFKIQTCQFSYAHQIVLDCGVVVDSLQSDSGHSAINVLDRKVQISLVRYIFDACEPTHTCWNLQWAYILVKISISNVRL